MSNKKLSQLVTDMGAAFKQVQSHSDILDVVQMAIDYDGDMKYKHGRSYFVILVGVIALAFQFFHYQNSYKVDDTFFYYVFATIVFIGAIVGWIVYQEAKVKALSRLLFDKDVMFDNAINEIELSSVNGSQLQKTFVDFDRGNYSREFKKFYQVSKSEGVEPALYYQYHYVDKKQRTVSSTGSNGRMRTRTETTYVHYNRYGLVFQFPYAQGLSINSNGRTVNQVKYRPSYGVFNDKFTIGANSEQQAAKYLKPALVEAIVTLSESFKGINIQISNDGQMLIAFDNCMLTNTKQQYDLKSPKEFYAELADHTDIVQLKLANQLYSTFSKYLDNNFEIKD